MSALDLACSQIVEMELELAAANDRIASLEAELAKLRAQPDRPWEPAGLVDPPTSRPTIVCLCGSTRFADTFRRMMLEETLAGRIVLTIGCDTKSDTDMMAAGELTADLKVKLDELHKRKIDRADEILVLNVGGYIGESTRSEIEYAKAHGKRVRWLELPVEPWL